MSKTIMIVDVDLSFHDLYKQMLEDTDYGIIPACDGDKALMKIFAGKPDLIILDIKLGFVNGDIFYEYLKSSPLYANIPVIIISNFHEYAKRVLKSKDKDLVIFDKTITSQKLIEEIKARIGQKNILIY